MAVDYPRILLQIVQRQKYGQLVAVTCTAALVSCLMCCLCFLALCLLVDTDGQGNLGNRKTVTGKEGR